LRPENEKSSPGTRVALAGQPVDLDSTRVAQPEQPRPLVERLAGGIVERRPDDLERPLVAHVEEQRVPAAREQAQERRLYGVRPRKERRDVAVQVVDRDERQPPRPGERLRRGDADQKRPDQAGALRDTDSLDVAELGVRVGERLPQRRQDQLEMVPGRDLRDDAAVRRVQLGLRGDDVGEHAAVPGDERGGGLVTRGLDPENQALARSRTGSFHMISASSRLSV
jgi:hypothetical protein